ncbi:hypothetical protein [Mucilaginibacter aquaedulcis]|uniref:hypothetical protein n=1 Tax=Mucilaginibacter aquaedulcis TaxID=1187081 RepID=UPI0025B3238A|nr:hypothetical protein [Mucilaginibacter aquaedulcis]MDN3549325.1 hypothetical protein [Mucilaginibacter aquaedulcis]
MLKTIVIENVKGIYNRTFSLNIYPNKPSLLVAPNGFGKSSFATAFKSMNNNRIVLDEEDYYRSDITMQPKISIEYEAPDGSIKNLEANSTSNTISDTFDYFVINNQIRPKGIGSQYGRATAKLAINDIVIVDRIPENISFNYQFRTFQERFGVNSKVLPNANIALNDLILITKLSSEYTSLSRSNNKTNQNKINSFINDVNLQMGAAPALIDWIEASKLPELNDIEYLNPIAMIIHKSDIGIDSIAKSYLLAIQLVWLYNNDPANFKSAASYNQYKLKKKRFDDILSTFNATWKGIKSSQSDNKLLVKFPKAIDISNGQRDILTFISMLFKATTKLKKDANILIIDEVFDYLDDANLTAAQYYITKFIDHFTKAGRRIYPLILTHLNPNYFKNFAFKDQKVYYLDKSNMQVDANLTKLLRNRNNQSIKDDVAKYLLHYSPFFINKRQEFRNLTIAELWGESDNFYKFLYKEADNYINGRAFCPFAVCGAVRVKIEEIAYNKLQSNEGKEAFLSTNMTKDKLEKADELGVASPSSHYFLGIIYNEGMHWKDGQDNVSPIAAKLEHQVIKKLIQDIFK